MTIIKSEKSLYEQALWKVEYLTIIALTGKDYTLSLKHRGAAAEWATIALALKPEKP